MSREPSPGLRLRARRVARCEGQPWWMLLDRVRRRPARRAARGGARRAARAQSRDRRVRRAAPRRRRRARTRSAAWSASGSGNFDLMGITDGPLRDWYGSLDVHERRRRAPPAAPARAEGVHAARGRRDPRRPRPRWPTDSFAELRDDGGGDLVAASLTLPLRVICRLIGVPDARRRAVRRMGRRAERRVRFPVAGAGRGGDRRAREPRTTTSTSCSSSGAPRPVTTS